MVLTAEPRSVAMLVSGSFDGFITKRHCQRERRDWLSIHRHFYNKPIDLYWDAQHGQTNFAWVRCSLGLE